MRNFLSTNNVLTVSATLRVCIPLLLISLCTACKPTAPVNQKSKIENQKSFQYVQFDFEKTKTGAHDILLFPYLIYYDRQATTASLTNDPPPLLRSQTNFVADIGNLLETLSGDGWQFVWTDGKTYLVRRPAETAHEHVNFGVEYWPAITNP